MAELGFAETLEQAAAAARGCTICAAQLPLGPRPVFRVSETARLLIVSQAPGTKVHETGVPFNDASGDRLRAWLGVDRVDDGIDDAAVGQEMLAKPFARDVLHCGGSRIST